MDHFNYHNGVLHAESMAIPAIAAAVGTPFYCYSHATLLRHYQVFCEGLAELDAIVCYAVKANSNLSVLATLANAGAGADVVSAGEIRRALKAGVSPKKIVFSGVGKTREEMAFALQQNIFQFNVESEPELLALNEVALSLGVKAPIAIRINPDVDAGTHAKISTGRKENKFGVAIEPAPALYAQAANLPGIIVQGVSMHIGSQLIKLDPFRAAYTRAREFVQQLRAEGHIISVLDVGGGLGIPYAPGDPTPPHPQEYGVMVREILGDLGCRLVFEPGRMIVGNAGILVSQVMYVKKAGERNFVILDAAMNDLIRPTLYGAYHEIITVQQPGDHVALEPADIVGPVCETGDTFAEARPLPPLKEGDLVAFRTAGAYGAVMSNSYNSRLLTPEVMVKGDQYEVVRARPSYDDLLGMDRIPAWV
jgi:diaminopimelate decarboxylase